MTIFFIDIDLAGFFPRFSYWVRRFFTKLQIKTTLIFLQVWRGSRQRGKVIIMPWSRNNYIIGLCIQQSQDSNIDPNINFDLFFAFNQTLNIFYPKILHTSFSAFDFSCHCYKQLVVATSYQLGQKLLYISTSFFWKKCLTCLIEPRSSSLLDSRLVRKNYLQTSAFLV